jgi:hypothetical protein
VGMGPWQGMRRGGQRKAGIEVADRLPVTCSKVIGGGGGGAKGRWREEVRLLRWKPGRGRRCGNGLGLRTGHGK